LFLYCFHRLFSFGSEAYVPRLVRVCPHLRENAAPTLADAGALTL